MRRMIKKAKYIWPGIAMLTVIGTLISLMGVVFALLSKRVLDVATGQAEGNLFREGLLLFAFLGLQLILDVILSVLNVHVSGKFQIYEKTKLFQTILNKNYLQISAYHSGELLNRINSDVTVITNGLLDILPNLFFYATKIVACFCALYVLDPAFALLCLFIGPLIFLTACLYRKRMKRLHKDYQAADGKVKSFIQETLKNLLVIKSFGCGKEAAEQSRKLQFKQFKISLRRNRISILANVFFYVGLTAGYYIALAWGAYKISLGVMTFGTLTALLQLVGQIQTPFQGLSSLLPQYYSMLASEERLAELENLPEDVVSSRTDWENEEWLTIALSGICFSYQAEEVLHSVDFTVQKGDFVVITGTSGTGKSTLLKVMLGILTPGAGNAMVKLADGTELLLEQARKQLFSYVPQGNLIVSGSIRDNIAFFKTNVAEEDIIEASKTAQIWDFINELPEGLNTVLGEGGLGLSEGQIQRLAIARAVLHGSPVLLLDEATSALDEETELAILKALKERQDKTCILVSHKKAALDFCDKVYHFEENQLCAVENFEKN